MKNNQSQETIQEFGGRVKKNTTTTNNKKHYIYISPHFQHLYVPVFSQQSE